MLFICPHCRSKATVRNSRQLTLTLRELFLICTNVQCGHTFVSCAEVMRTISPSATPDPSVRLPLGRNVNRRAIVEQMNTLPEAADTPEPEPLPPPPQRSSPPTAPVPAPSA